VKNIESDGYSRVSVTEEKYMARPLGKYLSSLEESSYKIDLEVVDRYQSFSAELLRLALLGIAGYGFLLSQIVFKSTGATPFLESLKGNTGWLVLGLVALGFAVASALGHRYYSTECITHYARLLRLLKQFTEPNDDAANANLSTLFEAAPTLNTLKAQIEK
jgi:hypothetical protein